MRENRSSGSVEGVMGNHDSYSDFQGPEDLYHRCQIKSRLLQQNAFVESFNSRLCDECLNEHVILSLAEARQPSSLARSITTIAVKFEPRRADASRVRSVKPGETDSAPCVGDNQRLYL